MTHAWLPRALCDETCVSAGTARVWRATYRLSLIAILLAALPLLSPKQLAIRSPVVGWGIACLILIW